MELIFINLILCGLIGHVFSLEGLLMECPGNQILVEHVRDLNMTTCGSLMMRPRDRTQVAYADLRFACRCPADHYLADDGITCVTADQCRGSTRLCPANQEPNQWLLDATQDTCYSYREVHGDAMMQVECGCAGGGVIGMDGQTCMPRQECPPACHGDQVLNLLGGLDCTPTCENRSPECGTQLISRCECPANKPILAADGVSCIRRRQCSEEPEYVHPELPVPLLGSDLECEGNQYPRMLDTSDHNAGTPCRERCWQTSSGMWPDHCRGEPVAACGCANGLLLMGEQCVRPEACPQACFGSNQIWNICASPCIRTCENPDPDCDEDDQDICVPRCDCPPDRPYLQDHIHCVSMEQCQTEPEPEPFNPCEFGTPYVDASGDELFCGRGSTLECPDGYSCVIGMADEYAVCCQESEPEPIGCPSGSPLVDRSGEETMCGGFAGFECPMGYFCVMPHEGEIADGTGFCCPYESECPEGMYYDPCGGCQETCNNPSPMICPTMCRAGCFCPQDAPVLLNTERCGTREQCDEEPPECEGDEILMPCVSCWQTCDDPALICAEIIDCQPSCGCPDSAPVSLGNGRCGTLRDCEEPEPECEGDEVLMPCVSCWQTCDNPSPMCVMIFDCQPGCGCPDSAPVSLGNGRCGTRRDCEEPEPECEGDEVLMPCVSCWQTCDDPFPICADIIDCQPSCGCPESAPVSLGNGRCGTLRDCEEPEPECEGDEMLLECMTCPQTCDSPNIMCMMSECTPGCGCPSSAPLSLGNHRCGTIEDCGEPEPGECEGDQVWLECSACPQFCGPEIACAMMFPCPPGCGCPADAPISLGDGRCGTRSDCEVCEGDEVLLECSACPQFCGPEIMPCAMPSPCPSGCGCPADAPISLGEGRCGTRRDCEDVDSRECEGDEVWLECSACPQFCGPEIMCDMPFPCPSGCGCPSDAPMSLGDGRCGTRSDCEVCEGDEVWLECPACPQFCGRETVCAMPFPCPSGCGCPSDAPVSLGDGRCGTRRDCEECPGDEVWMDCLGCPQVCDEEIVCDMPPECMAGCGCPSGTPVSLGDGHCGTRRDCEEAESRECEGDEVWLDCVACPQTCDNLGIMCMMPEVCIGGCGCPSATPVALGDGRCGTLAQCDTCEGDIVLDACMGGCVATCDNPTPICPMVCRPGCVCPQESVYLGNGRCGAVDECDDEPICAEGLTFNACGGCQATCDDPEPNCPRVCTPGCFCPSDAPILLDSGECVTRNRCETSSEENHCDTGSPLMDRSGVERMCGGIAGLECPTGYYCVLTQEDVTDAAGVCCSETQCPEGMYFHTCGGCQRTCQELNPQCTRDCHRGCYCPDNNVLLYDGRCGTEDQCETEPEPEPECEGDLEHMRCQPDELRSCENPDYPIRFSRCRSGCYCPVDRPFQTDNNHCVEECPRECPGEQEWNSCGSTCERTCEDPYPACIEMCVPTCECPSDRPILYNPGASMADPVCVDTSACPVCEGDMEVACSSVYENCEVDYPMYVMDDCMLGCYCPEETPVDLGNGRCGVRSDCPRDEFFINYANRAAFSVVVKKADNKNRLDPDSILQGHPSGSMVAKVRRNSQAKLELTIDGDDVQEATIGQLCIGTKFVEKIKLQYYDIDGTRLRNINMNVGRRTRETFISREVENVHKIKMTFQKIDGKKKIHIKDVRMPENENNCG